MDSKDPVSQISHKLRTPLTVIMSTVNNLLDGAHGDINDEQRKWLKKLESHTANLETLLNDTLELIKSQGVSGPISIKREKTLLPSAIDTIPGISQLAQPDPDGRVPQILIVDDEPDIREIIEEGMKMKGFDTLTASDGDAALKLALQHKPDLVLMDVFLKNQNGMDVCRKIKSQLPSFTPVLLVTGQNDLSDKMMDKEYNPDDLLTKPFQMEELFSRVTSMLRIKKLHDKLVRIQHGQMENR